MRRPGGAGGAVRLRVAAVLAAALLALPPAARAGAQVEEPLADAVRTALSAAVSEDEAPPELTFASADQHIAYLRWLFAMSDRLKKKLTETQVRVELLQTVWYESHRAGLDPALVLGLMQVESGFRKYAISAAGARGYMQVMPFWARLIGDGHAGRLFHMQTNLRFGCVILRHYLDEEHGDLFMALGRYNGSRGQARYPDAVLAAARQWALPAAARPGAGAAMGAAARH